MYGLTIELQRCPDGVELVEVSTVISSQTDVDSFWTKNLDLRAKVFRHRTGRREPLLRTIENLENPIVVAFVNATDDKQRQIFFSRFGLGSEADLLLWGRPREDGGALTGDLKLTAYSLSKVLGREHTVVRQSQYRVLLRVAGAEDRAAAMAAINSAIRLDGTLGLVPSFQLAGPRGTPQLLLQSTTLLSFMLMEIAMIVAHGASTAECKKCSAMFITGPLTGRRSHARYCSDRCRVAAMRARNSAEI
jgi:hypothetical protein